jgi:hypothetical protein
MTNKLVPILCVFSYHPYHYTDWAFPVLVNLSGPKLGLHLNARHVQTNTRTDTQVHDLVTPVDKQVTQLCNYGNNIRTPRTARVCRTCKLLPSTLKQLRNKVSCICWQTHGNSLVSQYSTNTFVDQGYNTLTPLWTAAFFCSAYTE